MFASPLMTGLAGASAIIFSITPALLAAFLVVYILGAVRARAAGPDPLLGVKVLLTLLISLAFQIVTLGLYLFLAGLFNGNIEAGFKQGFSLILGGIAGGAYPAIVFLKKVGYDPHEQIQRQAIGLNALLTGLVFVVNVAMVFYLVLNDANVAAAFAAVFAYGAAHTLCLLPLCFGVTFRRPITEPRGPGPWPPGGEPREPYPGDVR
ncbi:MAG: hypothetical protein KY476_27220 [Planctomycetes bacterium]|nr:hypothetical protein [Planctomycetota bacterium]